MSMDGGAWSVFWSGGMYWWYLSFFTLDFGSFCFLLRRLLSDCPRLCIGKHNATCEPLFKIFFKSLKCTSTKYKFHFHVKTTNVSDAKHWKQSTQEDHSLPRLRACTFTPLYMWCPCNLPHPWETKLKFCCTMLADKAKRVWYYKWLLDDGAK